MLRDGDGMVRADAAHALGQLRPPATAAVRPLIATLEDGAAFTRVRAAEALGAMGPAARAAVGPLAVHVESLRQRDPMTRPSVDRALQAIGAPAPPR